MGGVQSPENGAKPYLLNRLHPLGRKTRQKARSRLMILFFEPAWIEAPERRKSHDVFFIGQMSAAVSWAAAQ
jgi:hypothetical protein